jgi:hypothetical protein
MKKFYGVLAFALFVVMFHVSAALASMDFAALTTSLTTEVNAALAAVATIAALILGAIVGYRVYKRFTS